MDIVSVASYTFWSRFLANMLPRHEIVELSPETVDAFFSLIDGGAFDKHVWTVIEEAVEEALARLGEERVFVRNDQTSCKTMRPGFSRRACVKAIPKDVIVAFVETLECTMPWRIYREFGWVGLDAPPAKAIIVEECLEIERWDGGELDTYYGRIEARAAIVNGEVVEIWPYYYPSAPILRKLKTPSLIEKYLGYIEGIEKDEELRAKAEEAAKKLPADIAWSVDLALVKDRGWTVIDAAPLAASAAPCRGYTVLLSTTATQERSGEPRG